MEEDRYVDNADVETIIGDENDDYAIHMLTFQDSPSASGARCMRSFAGTSCLLSTKYQKQQTDFWNLMETPKQAQPNSNLQSVY